MAKRGFFRRIVDAVKAPFTKKVEPPKKTIPPFSLKAKDSDVRARRQQELRAQRERINARKAAEADKLRREESRRRQAKLRAKRKQIEYRKRREQYQAIKHDRSLPPSERAKRYQGYLRRYGKKQNPYPADETREFWMRFREAGGS